MKLDSIPILKDNYVWLLSDEHHTIIVDPGVAQPVIDFLTINNLSPTAILLTHHHHDHTDGINELIQHYPTLNVYGSQETVNKGAKHIVNGGETLVFGSLHFNVLSVPGHTPHHIAFYCQPYLFCGDTLFSAGCGRVFDNMYDAMYRSLIKLSLLPDQTRVCCTHEYTLDNLNFANSMVVDDENIQLALANAQRLRNTNHSTLPSLLADEKKINLFLRCAEPSLKQRLLPDNLEISDLDLFIFLRQSKNQF